MSSALSSKNEDSAHRLTGYMPGDDDQIAQLLAALQARWHSEHHCKACSCHNCHKSSKAQVAGPGGTAWGWGWRRRSCRDRWGAVAAVYLRVSSVPDSKGKSTADMPSSPAMVETSMPDMVVAPKVVTEKMDEGLSARAVVNAPAAVRLPDG